jgi:hypothetical protein
VTGTNLSGTTKVLFGTQAATAITTVSGTQPGATSPAESPGDRNIYVVTPAGTSAATPADGYYFEPPSPTVTAVSPRSGSSLGGTTVTITGTNVDGGVSTRVHFGLTTATGVKIISNTELTAVAPSHAAGLINVEVTTSGGTSVPSSADWFTYTTTTPIPFVSSLSPAAGPATGGTTVTVTGSYLTGATDVLFGKVAGTKVTVVSDTELTVTSPTEGLGLHDVFVVTPNGTSAKGVGDEFYAEPPVPVVTGVSPRSGGSNGGTTITITGTDLHDIGTTDVLVGTVAASVTAVSATEITAVTPPEAVGLRNVFVTTPNGKSVSDTGDEFDYQ